MKTLHKISGTDNDYYKAAIWYLTRKDLVIRFNNNALEYKFIFDDTWVSIESVWGTLEKPEGSSWEYVLKEWKKAGSP